VVDTPGHGKLRDEAWEQILTAKNLKGIVFVVDAANLVPADGGSVNEGLRDAAEYLHNLLLHLQARCFNWKKSKFPREVPVLIAVNKSDLFTALPAPLVKSMLEAEITRIRESRFKGLLDSGITNEDASRDVDPTVDQLGDDGHGKFEFSQMQATHVPVEVARGSVMGSEGANLHAWWAWIASRL
jgi:signal recognition particle receptor subunit beta